MKITFFMIVTDRDIVIADYAVRSYARIQGIPFRLLVYSNWVTSTLKKRYFPAWRQFHFVEIVENEWQTDDNKPTDPHLWGPFELAGAIWDRELKRIQSPYVATVDADFEILDAKFASDVLAQLDADPKLAVVSSDYSPKRPSVYDSYSDEIICLNEQWHTWFCVYRREALQVPVSHAYHEQIVDGPVRRIAWDDAGYLQRYLKSCFIHYGQFSHNRHINEANVRHYRRLRILRKVGLLGRWDVVTRGAAAVIEKVWFGYVDRSKYWEGWAKCQPAEDSRSS
jgi:hypothetical protein